MDEAEHRIANGERLLGILLEIDVLDIAHTLDLLGPVAAR